MPVPQWRPCAASRRFSCGSSRPSGSRPTPDIWTRFCSRRCWSSLQSRGTRYGSAESIGSTGDNHHLSGVRSLQNGDDADRRLSVVLQLQLLRGCVEAPTRRLLRVLFLRDRALSAGASRRSQHRGCSTRNSF